MPEPLTTLDPRYSDPAAAPTPWAVTCAALEAAQLAWLVTLRPDGRPHSTPVVPVWVENSMHFATGATEQKGKNLLEDDRVLLQVGGLDWEGGLDVVVEGRASLTTGPALLARLAAAWRRRWDGSWAFEVHGDRLRHPQGFEVLTYSVRPDRVLAFAQGKFGHTLHRF
jgi:pyridoxamine 5'-phosphate oxidase-like protein